MKSNVTESTANAFARYQKTNASFLRYQQAQFNMERLHKLHRPLRVLDAAGGNGVNTAAMLNLGHSVTLYDANPEMLDQARQWLAETNHHRRCNLVQGNMESIPNRLANETFDLILCHHIVEYLDDCEQTLADLRKLSAPDGELSLITLNPVSEVIRSVIFQKEPTVAHAKLADLNFDAKWFGTARLYTFEQVSTWAARAGWNLHDFRAIRVLADYFPETCLDEEKKRELLNLENVISSLDPYRRIGRYFQFCFHNS